MQSGVLDTQTQSPEQVRTAIRSGELDVQTAGFAPGYVQANLVILRATDANAFRHFCDVNPQPCPLLDMTDPGSPNPALLAPDADLRTDLPRYRVWKHGDLVDERTEISDLWRDDLVAFLLGCSYTFEHALLEAGLPVRNIEHGTLVPMYRTSVQCQPVSQFAGPLVVSMRPMPSALVERATEITSRYPRVHGGPVQIGDPGVIGIADLDSPDWGDPPVSHAGDIPMFWACGVTPQAVAIASKPEFMITHAPGHMFISDLKIEDLEAFDDCSC